MTRSHRLAAVCLTVLAGVCSARPASADIRLTPYGGVSFINDENKGTLGVSAALGGLIGFEFDASRIWLGGIEDIDIVELDAYVTTYMFNAVVRLPAGPIQPYGSAGVGVVRVTGNLDLPLIAGFDASAQDVGWNVGGGLYLIPTPIIGFRFDVRRFQTGDLEWEDIANIGDLPLPKFTFWRTTAGITIKF
jgi:hypothetical protein